jgi:hypothetical protein
MPGRISAKEKKQFATDFTTILAISIISNAKGLDRQDKQVIKQCLAKKQAAEALKVVERKYSPSRWKAFVEQQAEPILKGYVKDFVRA